MKKLIILSALLSLVSCVQYTESYCKGKKLKKIVGLENGVYVQALDGIEASELKIKRKLNGSYKIKDITKNEVIGSLMSCDVDGQEVMEFKFPGFDNDGSKKFLPLNVRKDSTTGNININIYTVVPNHSLEITNYGSIQGMEVFKEINNSELSFVDFYLNLRTTINETLEVKKVR